MALKSQNGNSKSDLTNRGFSCAPEGFFDVLVGFGLGAVGIVAGIRGFLVFRHGAFALPANIKDFAAIDVGPNLDPLRLEIAVQGFLEHTGCRLQIAEFE
jgi:hypothetical protein